MAAAVKRKRRKWDKITSDADLACTVRDILREHSGGIKMVELVTCILHSYAKRFYNQRDCFDHVTPDLIEEICRTTKDFKVLDYSHSHRAKMFVYLKDG